LESWITLGLPSRRLERLDTSLLEVRESEREREFIQKIDIFN